MSGDIIDAIDRAIADFETGPDAMRWTPDPPAAPVGGGAVPGRVWIVPHVHPYRPDCYCRVCWSRTRARRVILGSTPPRRFNAGGIFRGQQSTLPPWAPGERIICPDCQARSRPYDWVAGRSVHEATCPRLNPAAPTLADRINRARNAVFEAVARDREYILAGLGWINGLIPLWAVALAAFAAGMALAVIL